MKKNTILILAILAGVAILLLNKKPAKALGAFTDFGYSPELPPGYRLKPETASAVILDA